MEFGMEKSWIQWILPTDGGQLKSALGPADAPLTLWGPQGEKTTSYATRGPTVDFPQLGRPLVLGWPQGTEVAPQVRLSPPTTDAPWALLFGLEVNDAQGETTHLPPVGMNPLETMDLIWSLGDFLADVLKDLEFSVGSLTPDGRPGGHTFLIHGVTGSANFLFERLILFRAVLETIASARGFTAKNIQIQTDACGILPVDGQLLGMDF
ncbi:MAG: hypothetical protein CMH56_03935 [Myxococcales bacterium]|nr:hypothetical protein [Myxococcales bacterium]